ncbi:MAG: ABC transporter ATP-binding protein [Acetobacteraceae bacterium]
MMSALAHADAASAPVIEVHGLRKDFRGFVAVCDVSLAFKGPGITAIIGPNGAGKTTFFNLLSGFLAPTRGRILYRGRDICGLAPEQVASLGMVRSFQITSIFANLTVAENLLLPMQRRDGNGTEFWRSPVSLERYAPEVDALLVRVGIAREWRERPAGALPYGLKRALELGISLAMNPDVLLLDEPTAGMAAKDIGMITELIRGIARDRTVILVEHNLRVIANLAQEVVVMQQGAVLMTGSYDTVRRDARVIEAYLGGQGPLGHA